MSIERKFSQARYTACEKMEYLAHLIFGLVPIETEAVERFLITEDMRLLYNPIYFFNISVQDISAIILHSCFHIIQNHAERSRGFANKVKFNVACDLEIGDDLESAGVKMPEDFGHFTANEYNIIMKFAHLKCGGMAETYYDKIQMEDEHIKHCCGSGSGNPYGKGQGAESDGESKARQKAEIERMKLMTAEEIQKHMKERGNVPAGLKRFVELILQPPVVDWRLKLSAKIRKLVYSKSGCVDYTYTKPSRRGVKNVVMPSMSGTSVCIGVLVDTSGSMSAEDLGKGINQIRYILSQMKADLYLAVIDAGLHVFKKVSSIREVQGSMVGGGGTDLTEGFDRLNEVGCDVIVAISDCCAVFPEKCKAHTIWLVGKNHATPPFGEVIKID